VQNFVGTLVVDSIGVRMAALGFLNPLLAASIHVTSDFGLYPKFHKVVAAVIGTKRVC
jgi:hypothetical protein